MYLFKIYFTIITSRSTTTYWGSLHEVMAKVQDCGFEVSEFHLQLRYYVHFQTYTFGKDMILLIFLAKG